METAAPAGGPAVEGTRKPRSAASATMEIRTSRRHRRPDPAHWSLPCCVRPPVMVRAPPRGCPPSGRAPDEAGVRHTVSGATTPPTSGDRGRPKDMRPLSTTTSSGPKTAGCATASLAITFGNPNGTAGAIHYSITFHNTGSSTCALYGYPGVSFLAAGGGQIGVPAQREGNLPPATVTLAAGGNAYSSVAVTDPGIPPCSSSATATQVRIYPPGETHSALVAASGVSVCSSPNTPNYSSAIVAPVTASPV